MKRATTRKQRIGIWIIAITMTFGTVAGMVFMAVATINNDINPNKIAYDKYNQRVQHQVDEYKKKAAEERKKLRPLKGYGDKVGEFKADQIAKLDVQTIKEGTGATVPADGSIKVNYCGWTPDGKLFDSTTVEDNNSSRVFNLKNLIEGFSKGLAGKREGGVYLLSIPAEQAYGHRGTPDGAIAPDTPIKFMVEIVSLEKEDKK